VGGPRKRARRRAIIENAKVEASREWIVAEGV
jgi:hypothetical protein